MNRTQMIEALVGATLESALADPEMIWLREMLQTGFTGYEAMSIQALQREMQLRGLLEFDEPEPDEDFDDDEDIDDDDEDERTVMYASMVVVDRMVVDM